MYNFTHREEDNIIDDEHTNLTYISFTIKTTRKNANKLQLE